MSRLITIGTVLLGVGLLLLGAHVFVVPDIAAQGYGLGSAGSVPGWMQATGVRDIVLGLAVLGVLWRHRPALPIVLAASLLLPLGDVFIVLSSGAGWAATAPHSLGTVGIAVLLGMAMREARS